MGKVITNDNRAIAKLTATAFGTKPTVRAYWDDQERISVDVLQCSNPVDTSVIDYGTIGLSDYPMYQNGEEFSVRLEFVGTAQDGNTVMANLLTTAAFTIIKDKWFCYPGAVLMDVVEMYDPDLEVKHLYFTSPGLWDDNFETQDFATKTVAWLHAIPITERERRYMVEYSDEALKEIFERSQTDVANLKRRSVV